jgi:hypothetical protein
MSGSVIVSPVAWELGEHDLAERAVGAPFGIAERV